MSWLLFGLLLWLVSGIVLTLWSEWKVRRNDRWAKDLLPPGLNVAQIRHVNVSDWRFAIGPGGNEAGFLVYDMAPEFSAKLDSNALEYLSSALPVGPHGRRLDWTSTPLQAGDKGFTCGRYVVQEGSRQQACEDVLQFAQKYWTLPENSQTPEFGAQANQALFQEGSFFAFTRIGLVILSPRDLRIFYAFRG